MTDTTTRKWQADATLGPRQAKAFNEAVSKFNSEAKTITEVTDFGRHDVTPMFTGPVNPMAAPLMEEIMERFGGTVTAANYKDIIADLINGQVKLVQNRLIVDKRTTPEERAKRDAAFAENNAKEAAKAAHLATLQRHRYTLAETSAAVKRVLMTLYPGTKFSVISDSYSMGCSIQAHWTDGPAEKQVAAILDVFPRATFDGMEDLQHHIAEREWNGHLFDFSGDYVRGSRSCSIDFLRECGQRFSDVSGQLVHIHDGDTRNPYVERGGRCGYKYFPASGGDPDCIATDEHGNDTVADVVHAMAHHTSKEQPAFPYNWEWLHDEDGADPDLAADSVVFRILLGELKPTAPVVAPQAVISNGAITVSENKEKDGIEIRFAEKPDRAVLEALKSRGWRWSRFSSCWWHKATPDAAEFAAALSGGTPVSTEDHGLKSYTDIDGRMGA